MKKCYEKDDEMMTRIKGGGKEDEERIRNIGHTLRKKLPKIVALVSGVESKKLSSSIQD